MSYARRKCLKRDEIKEGKVNLEVYKDYSRRSCLMECKAKELDRACGCLPYFYPNFAQSWGHDTTCDLEGLTCLATNIGTVDVLVFYSSLTDKCFGL